MGLCWQGRGTSLAESGVQAAGGDYRANVTTGQTKNWPGKSTGNAFLKTIIMFCQVITELGEKIRQHMVIMGQSIDRKCTEQRLMVMEGQWSTEAPIVP